ncbi:unnamed protein product [Durusdinium trenchii]
MESHLSSQVLSETSRLWQRLEERLSSKPAPTSDAAEQAVRVHGPDTGLRRSLQSLEERFSAAQARQTRSEMTAQQALAQARQLEAILTEFNVEDHASFQTLSRQVRQISKTLADASRSVSSETFAAFQTNFFALEREVHWDLAVRLASLEETAANASSKGGASKEVRLPEPLRGPADVCLVGADEGLHFADGTVEKSRAMREGVPAVHQASPPTPRSGPPSPASRTSREGPRVAFDRLGGAR